MEKRRSALVQTFVVDASVAAGWFIADEANPYSNHVLKASMALGAVVPDLFWHEMRSLLTIAARRKRIVLEDVATSMTRLRELEITTVTGQEDGRILELIARYQLSAYDAAYLALSLEENLELATLDKQLIAAAPSAGCSLVRA
ncbi:type II toxin-antitoxin system VapC family toxin [Hyphomicrobiales bacterium]|jgi:predicted nucleic acid-binding protein|uniref:type II toxin-antitoxin system VapC family toxin n=1 Tax=Neorhizobium sp. DAR64872/K0K18 TaxID=3421958 RepID=UPI000DE0CC29|nr:type II toxin-antitoxin system VapC family toxin [uncultured Rhizobium sp.]